jgi:class 3 adenylate cyclase
MRRKAGMEDPTGAAVLPFPVHRRSTIDETLNGFPGRSGDDGIPGRRMTRRVTVIYVEVRGWKQVAERAGGPATGELLASALDAAVMAAREGEPADITVGGSPTQPVLWATFDGDDHARRALKGVVAVRDAVAGARLPDLSGHRFQACAGVNTGDLVEAEVAGGVPVSFHAVGTVRMFATRLQEFAGPGQIFLSVSTYAEAVGAAKVRSIGPVRTNPDGDTSEAFCLTDLLPDEHPRSKEASRTSG